MGKGARRLGVDVASFRGLLVVPLKHVPTIGSTIAAIPGVAVALLQLGIERALVLALVYPGGTSCGSTSPTRSSWGGNCDWRRSSS